MHVRYVFMTFPAPSEAFAALEIKALCRHGVKVSIACMRSKPKNAQLLLSQRGLTDICITYATISAFLQGMKSIVTRPAASLRLLIWILMRTWKSPRDLLISLSLLPRAISIARDCSAGDADVFHLFWGHYPSVVALAIRAFRIKKSITISLGAYDLERAYPLSALVARSAPIVTHAKANIRKVVQVCGVEARKVNVVYRGVAIPPDSEPSMNHGYILIAERLVAPKKTTDALHAFSKIAREFPESRLEVLGDGPEKRNLQFIAQDLGIYKQVRFRGHISHEKALSLMNNAALLLSMSQSAGERLPNVVKEAMARRCACIVTRTPGIEELVISGHTGHIVEPGDTNGAAARLRELLTDKATMVRMAHHGRQHVEQLFDIEKTTKRRIRFWESQLSDGLGSSY